MTISLITRGASPVVPQLVGELIANSWRCEYSLVRLTCTTISCLGYISTEFSPVDASKLARTGLLGYSMHPHLQSCDHNCCAAGKVGPTVSERIVGPQALMNHWIPANREGRRLCGANLHTLSFNYLMGLQAACCMGSFSRGRT